MLRLLNVTVYLHQNSIWVESLYNEIEHEYFRNTMEGYWISPAEADDLRVSVASGCDAQLLRWRLLGFYLAHSDCCLETVNYRDADILWQVENGQNLHVIHGSLLIVFSDSDPEFVQKIRAACRLRADVETTNSELLQLLAKIVLAVATADSSDYLERALSLSPDSELISGWLSLIKTAKEGELNLAAAGKQKSRKTCFYDIFSSADSLLESIRAKRQPSDEVWTAFSSTVMDLVKQPALLPYARYGSKMPADGPASALCLDALRYTYKMAASPGQREKLERPEMQELWEDLVGHGPA